MLANLNIGFTRLTDHPNLGKLILRLTIAGMMLFHGVAKLQNGVGWIGNMLEANGYPAFIAYGAYIGEVVAPLFIILGIFTRPMALIMAFNMLVATLMVNMGKMGTLTQVGAWGMETDALFLFGSLAIMFLGSGRLSVVSESYR